MAYRASTPAQHHILTTASATATAYAEKDFITAPGAGLPLCLFSPSDSEQHSARRQTWSALNARDSARGRRPLGQICATPPSTKSSAPLMKLASSDARKATAFATSAASPRRPIGTALASW